MTFDYGSIDLVKAYDQLDKTDPRAIVRFFESNRDVIYHFDEGFYFNMLWNYTEALFSAMLYDRYLRCCDEVLERLVNETHQAFPFRESMTHVLHRKVESLYALHQYPEAIYVCRELLKMNPEDLMARRFLRSMMLQTRLPAVRRMQAAGIVTYLLGIIVIVAEIIIIDSLFDQQSHEFRLIRYGLLAAAFILLVSSEIVHRLQVQQRLGSILRDSRDYNANRRAAGINPHESF